MALSFSSSNLHNLITLFNMDVTGPRVEVYQSFVLGSTPLVVNRLLVAQIRGGDAVNPLTSHIV